MNFADNLIQKIKSKSPIVIGIDPNFSLFPEIFRPKNVEDIQNCLQKFCEAVIDASFPKVAAVKFQSAYFEKLGIAGLMALSQAIKYAKSKDLITILDCKRGDIGDTSEAYSEAYLSEFINIGEKFSFKSDFEVDAITVNPFLGDDTLEPFVRKALVNNKGLFILTKTSNPGSSFIQDVNENNITISEKIALKINELGQNSVVNNGYSSIGAVVGATYPEIAKKIRTIAPKTIFLVPGIGKQGGAIENAKYLFDKDGLGALIAVSRDLTYFGNSIGESDFKGAIEEKIIEYRKILK